ncbi:MAG TPA: YkvA family protein [Flavipsychrobacter sp.]|nr:YkvA family protein [Flavipsychrobacter sp.]
MGFYKNAGKFNNAKHATELYHNRKGLWQMLSAAMNGNYKMTLWTTFILVFGIFYVIMPFDFDWIPIVGWIDDGFVIYWVIKRLLAETERFNKLRRTNTRNNAIEDAEIIE